MQTCTAGQGSCAALASFILFALFSFNLRCNFGFCSGGRRRGSSMKYTVAALLPAAFTAPQLLALALATKQAALIWAVGRCAAAAAMTLVARSAAQQRTAVAEARRRWGAVAVATASALPDAMAVVTGLLSTVLLDCLAG